MSVFFTLDNVIAFSVFLTMTLGVWGVLSWIADRPVNAEVRLKRVLNPATRRYDAAALDRQQDRLQAKVKEAASKLGKSLRPNDAAELGKVRLNLLNAGFRSEQMVAIFYGSKVLCMFALLTIAAPLLVSRYGMSRSTLTYAVMAAAPGG